MVSRVLTDMRLHDDAVDMLSKVATLVQTRSDLREDMLKKVSDADAAIIGGSVFNEEVFEVCSRLKIVARQGVGYDRVDLKAASERKIYVTISPSPELIGAVAEFAIGLILSLAKKIPMADRYVRSEEYARAKIWYSPSLQKMDSSPIVNLQGRLLGVVGLGRIGREIAIKSRCLGMKVQYFDITRSHSLEKEYGFEYVELDDLLAESDFVSVSVPLTEQTRGLIGQREISLMKPTAYLINTARGAILDQKALCDALKKGKIAGAGLDVVEEEPLSPNDPILELNNVIVTPHVAGASAESMRGTAIMACEDVIKVLHGKRPDLSHLVNPEILL